jgi:long-chain acyl-CoA synthetase
MTALTSPYRSLPEMFRARVDQTPDKEAYRYPDGDGWSSLTWSQTGDRVRALALGLHALGVRGGQRCAILAGTRLSWILTDLGILCAGAATTTIYPSSTAEDCHYILSDSESQVAFAEDDVQVQKLREHRDDLPNLHHVVTFDGTSDGEWVLTLDELEARGRELEADEPELFDELVSGVTPEDLACLVYTSGTTGRPKGVRLTQGNWLYVAETLVHVDESMLTEDDLQYLWLPLSHVFGKVIEVGQVREGFPTAVNGDVDRLLENMPVVRPTFMAAAPRIFEKAYARVVKQAQDGGAVKYRIFLWAKDIAARVSRLNQAGKPLDPWTKVQHAVADALVFRKLRDRFGGRLRYFVSGSAPLSPEIAEFFDGAGLRILEGYGLTETCAASFLNLPDDYRIGTVGKPLPGTEVSFLEDGEVLLRNGAIMHGYNNMPEETANAIDEDRWFHTGDIGRMEDGFLRITDRKKDLIKTSGGKYVAPQSVEGRLKAACPYVSQVVVHGDKRPYCTALVTLDEEAIAGWAQEKGLGDRAPEQLVTEPAVRELVQSAVDEVNSGLARHETIKSFRLLPRDLTIDSGEITPSLKVKRKVVESNHRELLDAMYGG